MESRHVPTITDRKTVEKNRRNQMKTLYSRLNSLIPNQKSKEVRSLPDQLDEARDYIKKLQENLERIREKKNSLVRTQRMRRIMSDGPSEELNSPKLEVHYMGSAMEVVLIGGFGTQPMFYEIIRVLHEEGAEVVNANLSVVEDSVIQTIHSEIGETAFASGMSSISKRLNKFVHDFQQISNRFPRDV